MPVRRPLCERALNGRLEVNGDVISAGQNVKAYITVFIILYLNVASSKLIISVKNIDWFLTQPLLVSWTNVLFQAKEQKLSLLVRQDVTTSTDLPIPWFVLPCLRGRPLRRLPSTVSWSIIFDRVSWRQTWPNHDSLRRNWRLTVKTPDIWRGYWPFSPCIFVCFMFSGWYAKHPPVAFVFQALDPPLQIRRQRPAHASIEQYWQDKWFVELILVGTLMALFCTVMPWTIVGYTFAKAPNWWRGTLENIIAVVDHHCGDDLVLFCSSADCCCLNSWWLITFMQIERRPAVRKIRGWPAIPKTTRNLSLVI